MTLTRLAPEVFCADLGVGQPEEWTVVRLRTYLVTHGYDNESAEWIVREALVSDKIEIAIPERRPH